MGDIIVAPRSIVMTNGTVTVTHEFIHEEQQAAHSLYLGDQRVTGPRYGDYTYWVSGIIAPAVNATILAASPNHVEVAFRFIHEVQGPLADKVGTVELTKIVALIGCSAGMYVRFESTPTTTVGEREIGLGALSTVTFSSAGVVANHPAAGAHVDLGIREQTTGPWWLAALPRDLPGAMSYIVLAHPMWALSYQFNPAQLGYPTINQITEDPNEAYQVFIGASLRSETDPTLLTPDLNALAATIWQTLLDGPGSVNEGD